MFRTTIQLFQVLDSLLVAFAGAALVAACAFGWFGEIYWRYVLTIGLLLLFLSLGIAIVRGINHIDGVVFGSLFRGTALSVLFGAVTALVLLRLFSNTSPPASLSLSLSLSPLANDGYSCSARYDEISSLLGAYRKQSPKNPHAGRYLEKVIPKLCLNCPEKSDWCVAQEKYVSGTTIELPDADGIDNKIGDLVVTLLDPSVDVPEPDLEVVPNNSATYGYATPKPEKPTIVIVVPNPVPQVKPKVPVDNDTQPDRRIITITKDDDGGLLEQLINIFTLGLGSSFLGEKITVQEIRMAAEQSTKDGNGKALEDLLKNRLSSIDQREKFIQILKRYGELTVNVDNTIETSVNHYAPEINAQALLICELLIENVSNGESTLNNDIIFEAREVRGESITTIFDDMVHKCIDKKVPKSADAKGIKELYVSIIED